MKNVKEILHTRQRKFIQLVATGMSITQAGNQVGYSQVHASRIATSEAGRQELQRLLQESEQLLLSQLPTLLAQSIDILKAQLDHPIQQYRATAAMFILKHFAKPMLADSLAAVIGNDTGGNIIDIVNNTPEGGVVDKTRNI